MRVATADELRQLNGLIAAECRRLGETGDPRDRDQIAQALLDEVIAAPTIPAMIEALRRKVG